jgi:peptide/nickel transport system substrate-binding protein
LIVPPGTDFDNPIGAGPFTLTEWTPGQTMSLAKNPTYWDADSILVGGIDMINVPPTNDQAAVSALNAEQIDWVRLATAVLDAAGGNTEVVSTADPLQLMQALICKSNAPVDSVEFRQAMNYAIDRELIIDALFGGNGAPAWDLWPEGHALHNPELTEHYAFNQERARELITESGVTDPSISIIPIPAAGGPETAAVIQQQLGEVGINVEIIPTTNFVEDFLINNGADLGIVPRSVGSRNKLDNFSGETAGNACQYSDPELDALVAEIRLVSDASDEGQQLWYDIQDVVVGDALSLLVMFVESVYGILPERVGGYELQLAGALPVPDMWTTYIKSS